MEGFFWGIFVGALAGMGAVSLCAKWLNNWAAKRAEHRKAR